MIEFNPNEVDVDVEKRTAVMAVFFFGMKAGAGCDMDAFKELIALLYEKTDKLFGGVVKVENGRSVDFYVRFDFGKHIPAPIWEMFDDPILSMGDAKTVGQEMTREMVLMSVQKLYPTVQKSFMEGAKQLQKTLMGKGADIS